MNSILNDLKYVTNGLMAIVAAVALLAISLGLLTHKIELVVLSSLLWVIYFISIRRLGIKWVSSTHE